MALWKLSFTAYNKFTHMYVRTYVCSYGYIKTFENKVMYALISKNSGIAKLVLLGGHLTALIECLTVLLEYIILISVDMTYSTQSWTGTYPPKPALGYATV